MNRRTNRFTLIGGSSVLLLLMSTSLLQLCSSCDLFVASKCPGAPAHTEYNQNYTLYCKAIKDHVDCINKKLKMCKNVQEFGPALETIKIGMKVLITQVWIIYRLLLLLLLGMDCFVMKNLFNFRVRVTVVKIWKIESSFPEYRARSPQRWPPPSRWSLRSLLFTLIQTVTETWPICTANGSIR